VERRRGAHFIDLPPAAVERRRGAHFIDLPPAAVERRPGGAWPVDMRRRKN
jgi:hypothetical protein